MWLKIVCTWAQSCSLTGQRGKRSRNHLLRRNSLPQLPSWSNALSVLEPGQETVMHAADSCPASKAGQKTSCSCPIAASVGMVCRLSRGYSPQSIRISCAGWRRPGLYSLEVASPRRRPLARACQGPRGIWGWGISRGKHIPCPVFGVRVSRLWSGRFKGRASKQGIL